MPRRAARIDENQPDIVQVLRGVGASVQILSQVGQGCPDLLVGFRSVNWLLEVKNPNMPKSDQALTKDEKAWHQDWQGQRAIVWTPQDALRVIGAIQ